MDTSFCCCLEASVLQSKLTVSDKIRNPKVPAAVPFLKTTINGSHKDCPVKERSGTSGYNVDGESLPRTTEGGDPLTQETPQKPMVDVFNRHVGNVSDERKEDIDYQHANSSDKTYAEIGSFQEEDRIFDEFFERMKLNAPAEKLDLDEPTLSDRSVGQLLEDYVDLVDDWTE
ncbi:unnamed protein product [Orchesella dallaii]|uniref:Uncharacterized protein n=1 Tax=Orchesella dallaii TaxID=48710 RepID=A0ABP1QN71_9HEXA